MRDRSSTLRQRCFRSPSPPLRRAASLALSIPDSPPSLLSPRRRLRSPQERAAEAAESPSRPAIAVERFSGFRASSSGSRPSVSRPSVLRACPMVACDGQTVASPGTPAHAESHDAKLFLRIIFSHDNHHHHLTAVPVPHFDTSPSCNTRPSASTLMPPLALLPPQRRCPTRPPPRLQEAAAAAASAS
jgi:hypothetical protein